MKSQKAKEFIDRCLEHLKITITNEHGIQFLKADMGDEAKRQLRLAMAHAVELAEQEMEGFYTCWINPEDFMPEPNKNILVKCSSGDIQTDFYAPELGGFSIEYSTYAKVIGWREIL